MAHHIKFKDKTSQKWFRSKDYNSKEEMMADYWAKIRAAACDVTFNSAKADTKEKKNMSEQTFSARDFVDAILQDDAVGAKDMFGSIVDARIDDGIDTMRPSAYGAVFGSNTAAPVQESTDPEDEDDEDEDEDDWLDELDEAKKMNSKERYQKAEMARNKASATLDAASKKKKKGDEED